MQPPGAGLNSLLAVYQVRVQSEMRPGGRNPPIRDHSTQIQKQLRRTHSSSHNLHALLYTTQPKQIGDPRREARRKFGCRSRKLSASHSRRAGMSLMRHFRCQTDITIFRVYRLLWRCGNQNIETSDGRHILLRRFEFRRRGQIHNKWTDQKGG